MQLLIDASIRGSPDNKAQREQLFSLDCMFLLCNYYYYYSQSTLQENPLNSTPSESVEEKLQQRQPVGVSGNIF